MTTEEKERAALREKMQSLYLDYVNKQGVKPWTSRHFLEDTDLEEVNFYRVYAGMKAMQTDIWEGFFDQTIGTLKSEAVYAEYSTYEKLLSFYFTLLEVIKPNRGYIQACFGGWSARHLMRKKYLESFKDQFKEYIRDLVEEGKHREEIASRMWLDQQYDKALWYQLIFVMHFWASDDSEDFARTDAAIEKAVRFSFDLLAPNAADSLFDLGRFVLQQWRGSGNEAG